MSIRFGSVVYSVVAAGLALPALAQADSIPSVVVTIENVQPSRGVFLTPPWIAIHDGNFDTYEGGAGASVPLGGNEIESLAEDGNNAPISATFDSVGIGAQAQGVAGPQGPLAPGDRASVTLNVDPLTDRYFSYASMIIPSNDFFIANGNALAHEIFDGSGNFIGGGFIVSGDETNDAGTEVNDEIAGNVAFLNQGGPNVGDTENGVVTSPAAGFAAPGTFAYPNGVLNYPVFGNGDFNDPDDRVLSVSFRFVDLGENVNFVSRLSPSQEIQPDPVDSPATGTARLIADDASELRITITFNNTTGPLAAAHLHLGQAGSNGPIVANLNSGIRNSNVKLTITESDLVGPLAGEDFVSFLNVLAAGNVYINLHSAEFPGGELRGQVALQ